MKMECTKCGWIGEIDVGNPVVCGYCGATTIFALRVWEDR